MTIDKIIVIIGGAGVIGFIWWFFFGEKNEATGSGEQIDILVAGGYKPSVIKIKMGKKTKLIFTRSDQSSCLEEVIIPDFKIKKFLPVGKKVEVEITPKKFGEFDMHCGMNMFHGKIVVE